MYLNSRPLSFKSLPEGLFYIMRLLINAVMVLAMLKHLAGRIMEKFLSSSLSSERRKTKYKLNFLRLHRMFVHRSVRRKFRSIHLSLKHSLEFIFNFFKIEKNNVLIDTAIT